MNSDNTSGITGVCRCKIKRPSGKVAELWIAHWYDENGKQRNKTFNIEKLGEEAAEQAAIAYRSEQLHLLELNHGITYSTRHGV